MRKGLWICLLSFFMIISLTGCLNKNNPEDVLEYLKRTKTSSADVTIHVYNDKQTLEYKGQQVYSRKQGSVFTLDDDRKFVLKDNNIYVEDKKNENTYTQDEGLDTILKYTFIQEYLNMMYSNGDLKYTFIKDSNEHDQYLMVDFLLPGTNRNLNNAAMYIDLDSQLPFKVDVFDLEGNKTIDITYENYKTNVKIDEGDFQVEDYKNNN